MLESIADLLSGEGFMPHGMCYLWRPGVLSLHIVSDALITLAYFSIPFTLLYFVRKRKDLKFQWMFVCFAIFIVACGTTHLMEIWVIWHPIYWVSGSIKAITALASVPTAILLVRLIPQALRLPSPAALEDANTELEREIGERKRAESEVRRMNEALEARVSERTLQLEAVNLELRREIRERQNVEQGLRESEGRLRAVLDSTLSAVIMINAQGKIVDWNPRAERIFGWTRTEVLGRELADTLIPIQHREAHRRGLSHFLSTGEGPVLNRLLEMTAVHHDGHELSVELSISPLKSGAEITFCGFLTDVTQRQQAQEALRSSQQLLQAIIDNSTAVIYVKDLAGRYLLVNRRFEELFHLAREWLIGKDDFDVFPTASAEAFRAVDQQVLAGGTALQVEEVAPQDDGPHTYVSSKCPLFDAAGKTYALCGISTDITERRQAEEALRIADRRKDEFIATLAHELRNPLAPIRHAVEIIRLQGPMSPNLSAARDVIDRQVRHLTRLVDDLLEVSRITRGKMQLRRERIALAAPLEDAVEAASPLMLSTAHEFTVSLPQEPIFVVGDATRITQIVLNLLNNAVKFTPHGGHIWLIAEREGGEVLICVRDTGVGIPAQHLSGIFEMFSQVSPALERAQGGLGIGLALVRGLVALHGGTIQASSAGPGKGSEFVVRLPIATDGESSMAPVLVGTESSPAGARRRILVVNDNRDAAESLSKLLQLLGHEVYEAHDGVEAIQTAEVFRPDIVLLDIGLPKLNGYDAAREIRRRAGDRALRIIAVTGWGQDEDKRRSAEAGFDLHLTKPVDAMQLQGLLAEEHGGETQSIGTTTVPID